VALPLSPPAEVEVEAEEEGAEVEAEEEEAEEVAAEGHLQERHLQAELHPSWESWEETHQLNSMETERKVEPFYSRLPYTEE